MNSRAPRHIELAEASACTGCAACQSVCPKSCIDMKDNTYGVSLPEIDREACIECGLCMTNCPILDPVASVTPIAGYAAWSTDSEERRTSASGGIAAELYKDALRDGRCIAGAVQAPDFNVSLTLGDTPECVESYKNSKYVFSDLQALFKAIGNALSADRECLVVGLPCQIAAVKKVYKNDLRLTLVDVVCHGTVPTTYLQQHIKAIETTKGKKAVRMSFRDHEVSTTDTFTFALYDSEGRCFYTGRGQDNYNFGFQRGVSYRDNCYNCPFAGAERCSDITLGDYKGSSPDPSGSNKVSSVLANTEKGRTLIEKLSRKGILQLVPVKVDEIVEADERLSGSVLDDRYHRMFLAQMDRHDYDFERSISSVKARFVNRLRIQRVGNRIKSIFRRRS